MIFQVIEESAFLTALALSFLGGISYLAFHDYGLFIRFYRGFHYVFWALYAAHAVWHLSGQEHFHRAVTALESFKEISLNSQEYSDLKAQVVSEFGFRDAIFFGIILGYLEILRSLFKKDNKIL